MTNDWWIFGPVLLAGGVAGSIFFGGLWWTVQRLMLSKHPAGLMLLSFTSRVVAVLGIFFLVGRGHPDRLLICLLGFLIARILIVGWQRRPGLKATRTTGHVKGERA